MSLKYRCLDCDAVFYQPREWTEEYEVYGRPLYHSFMGCPYCAGAFEEEDDDDDFRA